MIHGDSFCDFIVIKSVVMEGDGIIASDQLTNLAHFPGEIPASKMRIKIHRKDHGRSRGHISILMGNDGN